MHGQSDGLRSTNSDEETNGHAQKLSPLITYSLGNHVTIVAGYSGQADAALPLMTEVFNEQHHLIWLGHDEKPGVHLASLLKKKYTTDVGGCDFDRTMINVGQELGCFPPEVIRNPPEHILNELSDVADYPVQSETELDVLTDTRDRIKTAASNWEKDTGGDGKSQQALLSGLEMEVGDSKELSDVEREAHAWSLVSSGNSSAKEASSLTGDAAFKTFEKAYAKYAKAVRIKSDMHYAFNNWGVA